MGTPMNEGTVSGVSTTMMATRRETENGRRYELGEEGGASKGMLSIERGSLNSVSESDGLRGSLTEFRGHEKRKEEAEPLAVRLGSGRAPGGTGLQSASSHGTLQHRNTNSNQPTGCLMIGFHCF